MIMQRQRIITFLGLTSLVATMVTVTRYSSNFGTQRLVRQVSVSDLLTSSEINQIVSEKLKNKLIKKYVNKSSLLFSSPSSSSLSSSSSSSSLSLSPSLYVKKDSNKKKFQQNFEIAKTGDQIMSKSEQQIVQQNAQQIQQQSEQQEKTFPNKKKRVDTLPKRVQYASQSNSNSDYNTNSNLNSNLNSNSNSNSNSDSSNLKENKLNSNLLSSSSSSVTSLPIVSVHSSETSFKSVSSTSMKVKNPGVKVNYRSKIKLAFDKNDLKTTEKMQIDKINFCDSDHGASLDLLVMVVSSASHFEARQAIRKTWGQFAVERGAYLLFLVGATYDRQVQSNITVEDAIHQDILQGQYIDHYYNLTLKTISMMKWISENCEKVKWVLKVDDDMFVNMQHVTDFSETRTITNVIIGKLAKKWKPHRDPRNKWYVPYNAFVGSVFPNFATGPAYIISGEVAEKLYKTSLKLTPIYLEDVFMTGIVAEKAGVRRLNHGLMKNVPVKVDQCSFRKIMTSHKHSPRDIIRLWDLVYNEPNISCDRTARPNNTNGNNKAKSIKNSSVGKSSSSSSSSHQMSQNDNQNQKSSVVGQNKMSSG